MEIIIASLGGIVEAIIIGMIILLVQVEDFNPSTKKYWESKLIYRYLKGGDWYKIETIMPGFIGLCGSYYTWSKNDHVSTRERILKIQKFKYSQIKQIIMMVIFFTILVMEFTLLKNEAPFITSGVITILFFWIMTLGWE